MATSLVEEFKKLYPAAHDRNQPRGVPPGPRSSAFWHGSARSQRATEGSSPGRGRPHEVSWSPRYQLSDDGWHWLCAARIFATDNLWHLLGDGRLVLASIRRPRFGARYRNVSGVLRRIMGQRSCWSILRWRKWRTLLSLPDEIQQLKQSVIDVAARAGFPILRKSGDRLDVPIDYRFWDVLLRSADDPGTVSELCTRSQGGSQNENAKIASTI